MITSPVLAEVAVNRALRPTDSRQLLAPQGEERAPDLAATFHYRVGQGADVRLGHHVWVNFANSYLPGIVVGLGGLSPVAEERLKPVGGLLHPQPMLTGEQIALARWISRYYHCALYEALSLMLPRGFEQKLTTVAALSERGRVANADHGLVGKGQRAILDLLKMHGSLTHKELATYYRLALGVKGIEGSVERIREIVSQLVNKELVQIEVKLEAANVKARIARFVRLTYREEGRVGTAQKRALAAVERCADGDGWADAKEVILRAPATLETLRGLVARGLLEMQERESRRDPLARTASTALQEVMHSSSATALDLTPQQADAVQAITAALDGQASPPGQTYLLHGVTGSGKTEVYLQAISHLLAAGGQAIVLVPEISLTPQTVSRFTARFPGRVAVLHSGLSDGERHDEWQRIARGQADIVIGARSAIFAPLTRLQLIVIDEEHDQSYKQGDGVRYQTRAVAQQRAVLLGPTALVVLGSATPDVGSYQQTMTGQAGLLEMPKRVGDFQLPPVQVVDMRAELRSGNLSMFSRALHGGIVQTLADGKQAILFLNRRGSATFVMCRDCGHVAACYACEVPYAYHADENTLICHRCDRRARPPEACPLCHSRRIKHFGAGTQKVVEEVQSLFPAARVLRWDRDSSGGRDAHDRLLGSFVRGEADIMVGTQMIAKGLDIAAVTLVGVVSADTSLYLPDLRAAERTFQLLTQVAGRAGRRGDPATVIFQTYTPEHYAIEAASHHDYASFYRQEIFFRQDKRYPPFSQLVSFVYSGTDEAECKQEAANFARVLERRLKRVSSKADLIGPAPAFIRKHNGRYRWQIIARATNLQPLLNGLLIPQGWIVDVDPASVL